MKKNLSYEEATLRLSEIVAILDKGDISLSDSINLFEEGVRLSDYCYKTLKNAEQKIVELTAEQEQNNE